MIIVHQMAKVASRSWIEAARPAVANAGTGPLHCHYIVPRNRARIAAAYDVPEDRRTIANMLMPRNLLRNGAAVWARVEAARERQERVRVVSGVRDPVARSISLIVFMADFYGQAAGPLHPGCEMSPDDVIRLLHENWRMVLQRHEPDRSFEWLLWFRTDAFRTWFADEMVPAFGADVLREEFCRPQGGLRMATAGADILVYRVEDMSADARGHANLLAAASRFLGTAVSAFPDVNTSQSRRSGPLSAEVRRRFRLPATMLDAIYAEPIVRHFYSDAEIDAFRRRWSAPAPDVPAHVRAG